MLLYLSTLGIILSIILLYFNARRFTSSIFLGGFFFLVSFYGFIQYILLYSESVFLVSIIFVNAGFLVYLTGPMLYWYFRSILTDESRLRKRDIWHLLPMLLFLAGALNYIFTPWSYKVELATKIVENPDNLGVFSSMLLYQVVSKNLVFLSRPFLILVYALWSLVIFVRFLINKRESNVFSQQKYMTKWLSILLAFLFILLISHLFLLHETFMLREVKLFFTLNILQVLSGVGLAGLLISPFFFPGILYGLPQLPGTNSLPGAIDENNDILHEKVRKNIPDFEAEYLLSIQLKADSCMAELQPYLQEDCNLASFSKFTKIPSHHLSYLFREVKKQSFNDYRNGWRVKHAKNLLLEGKAKDLTLEAIGLLSGFATRNTFFTAFKKVEGVSPGAFLTQNNGELLPKS